MEEFKKSLLQSIISKGRRKLKYLLGLEKMKMQGGREWAKECSQKIKEVREDLNEMKPTAEKWAAELGIQDFSWDLEIQKEEDE
jgi:hypothetical protein